MRKIIFLDFDGVITTMASRYALDRYKATCCWSMPTILLKTDGYLGLSQADAVRAVCLLNGCQPSDVIGIIDISPFDTFEKAYEESMRSAKEEGEKILKEKEKEIDNE